MNTPGSHRCEGGRTGSVTGVGILGVSAICSCNLLVPLGPCLGLVPEITLNDECFLLARVISASRCDKQLPKDSSLMQ